VHPPQTHCLKHGFSRDVIRVGYAVVHRTQWYRQRKSPLRNSIGGEKFGFVRVFGIDAVPLAGQPAISRGTKSQRP
jgi:hypothetical protein